MVDILALVLSHGLLALAAWRPMPRDDLDTDAPMAKAEAIEEAGKPGPSPRKGAPRRMVVPGRSGGADDA